MRHKQAGQMSIFFGIMVMVVISLTALIINVGLFVKAKINLQNAVDAAAYSGASVQARQLTHIAYLNWEMRNVFKEWMFKYYVLGNIGSRNLNGPDPSPVSGAGGQVSNFQMRTFLIPPATQPAPGHKDVFNIPSVCIQFDKTTADCDNYKLPALPRFQSSTQIGIANTTDVFIDTLSSIRSKNCASKSAVNFEVAAMWAFSVGHGSDDLAQDAPQLLSNRPGAYTKAFELAVRVRNLESLLNKAPLNTGVCHNQGQAAGPCQYDINSLSSQNSPHLERSVKAFYSAYRNLGNDNDSEMKGSFTLTEIPPAKVTFGQNELSQLLYTEPSVDKFYADLKLMPVNYTVFYTAFATPPPSEQDPTGASYSTGTSFTGGCDATKVAIPVPGYPLGFIKNPNLLTYYAVRGEAHFNGLFNPFKGPFTKLTAYAAAKPFGGRVGPALFNAMSDKKSLKARRTEQGALSRQYSVALDINKASLIDRSGSAITPPYPDFLLGVPIPIKSDFWVLSEGDTVGGGDDPNDIKFSIPNLVYTSQGSQNTGVPLMVLVPDQEDTSHPFGLYSFDEYERFKANLNLEDGAISPDMMEEAVKQVRAPTDYEARNYLIPAPSRFHQNNRLDSFAAAIGESNSASIKIYAPLWKEGSEFPYQGRDQFRTSFKEYLIAQQTSIERYLSVMKNVSESILNSSQSDRFALDYSDAANIFYSLNSTKTEPVSNHTSLNCTSIAGKFFYYFLGTDSNMIDSAQCPTPFFEDFAEYWGGANTPDQPSSLFYQSDDLYYPENVLKSMFTAYAPGPRQGASPQGVVKHPIFSSTEKMTRNYYSTKFIPLRSLSSNIQEASYNDSTGFANFSQGQYLAPNEMKQSNNKIENTLESGYIHHNLSNYYK